MKEAEMTAALCSWFLGRDCSTTKRKREEDKKQNDLNEAAKISVITFYNAQVTLIKSKLSRFLSSRVRVSTVDSFQGSESDVVILSCVRSNARHVVGFVSEFRRLNVALTRAKLGLIVLCHADTLENGPSDDLKMLIQDARRRGVLRKV